MPTKSQNKVGSAANPRRVPVAKKRPAAWRRGDIKFEHNKEFGKYVVADPKICHGRITFRGTRIFVRDVLDMVAEDMNWDAIVYECHGFISKQAISEAVKLASQAFLDPATQSKRKSEKRVLA
ncbi:MAG: DUF433 domain-containing protein [Gemmataceae bacterium]